MSEPNLKEEADETLFWPELLEGSGIVPTKRLSALKKEADELVAIINTAKRKLEVGTRKSELNSKRASLPTSRVRLPTS